MTAEVAILNASAVALAADSAVTISDQKIYDSALKLFSLSKTAPVGVMIYGNAYLMEAPWEVIIKSYRKSIKNKRYNYLEEYASDFIKHINDNTDFFPESSQKRWLQNNVASYYSIMQKELFNSAKSVIQDKGEITAKEASDLFSKIIGKHHSILNKMDYSDGMNIEFFEQIRKEYVKIFKRVREDIFEKIKIDNKGISKLYDIGAWLHVKHIKHVYPSGLSGVVIAGYGEKEIYPSLKNFEIEGVIKNRLKYRINEEQSETIKSGMECRVIAFAQDDMVATFMNGVNPAITNFTEGFLKQVFKRLPEILEKSGIKTDEIEKFKSKSSNLLSEFFQELKRHIQEKHVHPVLRMVTALPKDEIASMAEALVNLTAFKRKMTESIETVGGPIDVAIISKGDGLVWVKRKHYFPAELNQHFFANYFREIEEKNKNEKD